MKRVKVTGDMFHGRVPDGAVYVGRGKPGLKASPFANPWPVGPDMPLDESLRLYREHIMPMAAQVREQLAGHDLACWCPLGEPCHADILLQIASS